MITTMECYMKTKKIHQKLTLKKETIANLSYKDLNVVYGGLPIEGTEPATEDTCWTIATICPTCKKDMPTEITC